jgi:hypothetical protein
MDIQRVWKGVVTRWWFARTRRAAAARRIQRLWRYCSTRARWRRLLFQRRHAIRIQAVWRMHVEYSRYQYVVSLLALAHACDRFPAHP